jgi:hypothetical protein
MSVVLKRRASNIHEEVGTVIATLEVLGLDLRSGHIERSDCSLVHIYFVRPQDQYRVCSIRSLETS